MDFDRALNEAIERADWIVDSAFSQGDMIIRDISQSKSRGAQIKIHVRRPEVAGTWDKWDENKQNRGLEKFATYVANTLRRMMPGMSVFLTPDSWTPDA